MRPRDSLRVGYVLKRYPRYSETFIINEILAHEAAGTLVDIFSLRPPNDTFFPEQLARVRSHATYIPSDAITADAFWTTLTEANELFADVDEFLDTVRAEGALLHDVFQALRLAIEADRKNVDHFHAHFATAAADVARMAARLAGKTYSITAHAKDIFHESVRPDDLRRKLRDAVAVITVSEFNREYLRTTFGPAANRVHRVYNGLDLSNFQWGTPVVRPARIVGVGRLVEKKGFADLIQACRFLADRGCPFECQIIGGGELEAQLHGQIERLGLRDQVTLLGPKPQSEVIAAVRSAAVVAAPCVVGTDGNRDGLPTVLLEAMALGTPCVSTPVTGIPEVLRDGETGIMVPTGQPPQLADAMQRLLSDSNLRVRLATTARRLIESDFDIHRNTARIRELFAQTRPRTKARRRELEVA